MVISAGGWLPQIAGLDAFGIALPRLKVTAQAPVHFAIRPGFAFPSFVHHVGSDAVNHTFAYGAYGLESPGEGVKVGIDTMDVIDDLDVRTLEVPQEAIEVAADYARRWLPGADTDVAAVVSCLFTMTDARWKRTFEFMRDAKLVKPGVDVRRAYTLQFVNRRTGLDLKPKTP